MEQLIRRVWSPGDEPIGVMRQNQVVERLPVHAGRAFAALEVVKQTRRRGELLAAGVRDAVEVADGAMARGLQMLPHRLGTGKFPRAFRALERGLIIASGELGRRRRRSMYLLVPQMLLEGLVRLEVPLAVAAAELA